MVAADASRGPTPKWMMAQHRGFGGFGGLGVKFSILDCPRVRPAPGVGSQPVMTPQHSAALLSPSLLQDSLLSPAHTVAVWEGCPLSQQSSLPDTGTLGLRPHPSGWHVPNAVSVLP